MKQIYVTMKYAGTLLIVSCLICFSAVAADITVKDGAGTLHRFSAPPANVVSIVPSATEIIIEIGAGNAITGLTYHDATLEGAQGKTVVGGFFAPYLDKIVSLSPDLVIVSDLHKDLKTSLAKRGINVFVFDTLSLEHSFETIRAMGALFGKEKNAESIIQKNREQIQLIAQKLAKAAPGKKKRVIRLMGRGKVMTPGNDSFQNDLIRMAGGIAPDFGKKGSVVDVTREEWIKFNPEVIYGCGGDRKTARAFFQQEGWNQVDAVKNNRIYYFPCELTCRAATHSGYFIQWLSSMVYMEEFSRSQNDILPNDIKSRRPVQVELDYVNSAAVNTVLICDFPNKTLMVDFKRPMSIVSTLEGRRDQILTVGNHYSPPPTWGPGHFLGIEQIRAGILKANRKNAATTSFLITGANMDNLSVQEVSFKKMKVVALVTAGVMSNAVRMSKDEGMFYEPGTINIIIMTNMELSGRAMTRAIISATEAKTAALDDMDIRSTATPIKHEATGTGTDNVLVVQGEGKRIENAGGHTKMGELIATAVYEGVREAVLKQNRITEKRHIFQRLKERGISVLSLTSNITCDCMHQNHVSKAALSRNVEYLLLEKKYSGFLETALTVSDEYEKGLIKDLTLFNLWCRTVSSEIAGENIDVVENYVNDPDIPKVLRSALNALITGVLKRHGSRG